MKNDFSDNLKCLLLDNLSLSRGNLDTPVFFTNFTYENLVNHFPPFVLHCTPLCTEGSLSRGQKEGLALDLGCAALAIRGQKVDVKVPLLKQG